MPETTPELIANDAWLQPFSEAIVGRLKSARIKEAELLSQGQSLSEFASGYLFFGIHKTKDEWILREWAPNASAVFVIGEFTGWEENGAYQFEQKDTYWELRLPLKMLKHNDLYKLMIHWNGGRGERIPAWATRVVQDEQTKIFNAQIWDPAKAYKWKIDKYVPCHKTPIIYEAHVGMATEEYKVGTYKEFTKLVLPRIKKQGYNTIQLMAIQEHPYYGSFGYHVSSFFAASSRFGTPDELKELIDTAHQNGMSVIMDIVHSHAVKNEIEGLGKYDGTPFQFFHKGSRGDHEHWDSKCFDYGKNEVLHFLLSNCKYWIEEFKFDGFRFDGVTSMLYYDHGIGRDFNTYDSYFDGGQDGDAINYLILANKLIHELNSYAITVAEEVSGMPGLATPLNQGGYGFDFRLAMGIPDFWIKTLKEKRDEDWHVGGILYEMTQARNDEKTISYAESHDQALVGDKTIAFWLMDKEMYTSMHVGHQSLVVDRGMALHKMIRLITFSTAKNGYLTFMGNEFGHPEWVDFPREGNNWSFHYARRQWSLAENPDLRYKFLNQFDIDMLRVVNERQYFFDNRAQLVFEHASDQVLVYQRDGLYFFFNFNPNDSFFDYGVQMPEGAYTILLNTDSGKYGGMLRVDESLTYYSTPIGDEYYDKHQLKVYLPCRSALVFKRSQ